MPQAGNSGPDLSVATEAVEELMDDYVTVKLDDGHEFDDTFDDDLGVAIPDLTDDKYLYQGKATIVAEDGYRQPIRGGSTISQRDYKLFIPLTAPQIPVSAIVRVDASRRDPQLVGQRFAVTDTITGTFSVSRRIAMTRIMPDTVG